MKKKKGRKQKIQDVLVVFMAGGVILKNIVLAIGVYAIITNYQLFLEMGEYLPKETTGAIVMVGLLGIVSRGMVIGKQV